MATINNLEENTKEIIVPYSFIEDTLSKIKRFFTECNFNSFLNSEYSEFVFKITINNQEKNNEIKVTNKYFVTLENINKMCYCYNNNSDKKEILSILNLPRLKHGYYLVLIKNFERNKDKYKNLNEFIKTIIQTVLVNDETYKIVYNSDKNKNTTIYIDIEKNKF